MFCEKSHYMSVNTRSDFFQEEANMSRKATIEERVWKLHREGFYTHEIADMLDITEYRVVMILGL